MARDVVLRFPSRMPRVLAVLALLVPLMIRGGPVPLAAADLSGDVSIDSKIEMIENPASGPVRVRSIVIDTANRDTTLTIESDSSKTQTSMPYEEYEALWQYLLERDVGNMSDAPSENLFPDQSQFTFTFQNGVQRNTFSAYGVDFLSDSRYREIARAILEVARKYSP